MATRTKLFFFFSYQGTRNRQTPIAVNWIVPTEAERRGDFSALSKQLRNPFAGGVYPSNRIPLTDFNLAAKAIVDNYLPVPLGSSNTISVAAPMNLNDQVLVRADHHVGGSNLLTGRFWLSNASTPASR